MDVNEVVNIINSTDDKTSTVKRIDLSGTSVIFTQDKISLSAKEINIQ